MKKQIACGLLFSLCLMAAACGANAGPAALQARYQSDQAAARDYMPPEDTPWRDGLRLSRDEALADFDEMWAMLWHNASFLRFLDDTGAASGLGADKLAESVFRAREALEKADTAGLDALFAALNSSFGELRGRGHLTVMSPDLYDNACRVFSQPPAGFDADFAARYLGLIDSQKSRAAYAELRMLLGTPSPGTGAQQAEKQLVISEEQGVPCVKITSFLFSDAAAEEAAIAQLRAFCKANAAAPDLIVDIRGNGGGNDIVWIRGLVGPLQRGALRQNVRQLSLDGPLTRYLRGGAEGAREPDASLPWLTEELAARLPAAWERTAVYPAEGGSVGFQGRLWLLVDGGCASASDCFASLCRSTGFARVVGTRTQGGGLSSQPVAYPLSNSGLCVFFEDIVGLNLDGTCNAFTGTPPDHEVAGDALSACLRLISQNQ